MFTRHVRKVFCKVIKYRQFHTTSGKFKEFENPIKRTLRVLADDFRRFFSEADQNEAEKQRALMGLFPRHADVVIIGGGAMGSSIAYWLKEKTNREGLRVVVIEKDFSYSKCSTVLSVGGLRQQFSLPENIQMSVFGAEFLRTLKKRFGPEADVHFTPNGYLILSGEDGAQQLVDNSKLQNELGAVNRVLTPGQLKQKFPWMNVKDVEVGCLGLEKEGWFDPYSLLTLMRSGAQNLGAQYIQGEVVDFTFSPKEDLIMEGVDDGQYQGLQEVVIKMPDGEHRSIEFAYCILAAGAESQEVAQLARVGLGRGMLSVPLPVEKRKRYVFRFETQGDPPAINSPLTIDYSGAYFRRDGLGGCFLGGLSPNFDEEPPTDNLDVDYQFFDDRVWPLLANRVPGFESIKVKSGWGGFYEYNCFDENGIIGPHPYYTNLLIATGFSGHGIQQSPAVGRAIAELILEGDFKTIDLTRLGFDRLIVDKPMYEVSII